MVIRRKLIRVFNLGGMDEQETREFVKLWNEKNGYEDGINQSENMRIYDDGSVHWNVYDSPLVDIDEFVAIHAQVKKN
jgi:hypothetical protein